MRKSDGVRVHHRKKGWDKKSPREKERWGKGDHEKKRDGVRVDHKKERWGENLP